MTKRKARGPRMCACGCNEPVPLTRRAQAKYVDDRHKIRNAVRMLRARRAAGSREDEKDDDDTA